MKPCWRVHGLTEDGAAIAEKVLKIMMRAVEECDDPFILDAVVKEALFRKGELPKRTEEYQKKYRKENF